MKEASKAKPRRRFKGLVRVGALALGVHLGLCCVLATSYAGPKRWDAATPEGLSESALPGSSYAINVLESQGFRRIGPSTKSVVVFAHGFGGRAGEWVNEMNALEAKGIPSVAIHMAGHGKSAAMRVGFGPRESQEILDTVKEVRKRTSLETRVIVVGRSMGGAAAWMAAGRKPDEIDGLLTEAAFSELDSVSNSFLADLVPGGEVVFQPVRWFTALITGVNPTSVRPIDLAPAFAQRPAIIAHSRADELVPFEHAERLVEATGAELWEVEGSAHAQLASDQPDLFVQKILKLIRLGGQTQVPSSMHGTR